MSSHNSSPSIDTKVVKLKPMSKINTTSKTEQSSRPSASKDLTINYREMSKTNKTAIVRNASVTKTEPNEAISKPRISRVYKDSPTLYHENGQQSI